MNTFEAVWQMPMTYGKVIILLIALDIMDFIWEVAF